MYAEHLIVVPLHGTLHGLNNARNSSIVWVHFILEDEVHSNCDSFKSSQGRDDCISDIGHLPYTVLSLISDGAKVRVVTLLHALLRRAVCAVMTTFYSMGGTGISSRPFIWSVG